LAHQRIKNPLASDGVDVSGSNPIASPLCRLQEDILASQDCRLGFVHVQADSIVERLPTICQSDQLLSPVRRVLKTFNEPVTRNTILLKIRPIADIPACCRIAKTKMSLNRFLAHLTTLCDEKKG